MSIRLHMPAIPHTITRDDFSHCAFTGKVKRFGPMMRSVGFEVVHYGVEGAESGADIDVQLMTQEEWRNLRIESYMQLHPELSRDAVVATLENPSTFISELANTGTKLYAEFNRRLGEALKKHYRSKATDILCLPFGHAHDAAHMDGDYVKVESGIGYNDSKYNYRIFESYAWLNHALGKECKAPQNYWFVVPNYFDITQFPLSLTPERKKIGFLGRIGETKGCHIIPEVARRFPDVDFIICGQGDHRRYTTLPNVHYKAPIHGAERGEYLGSLTALLCPSIFLEPFCGVSVEAQLCGTPVITHDSGALRETVEQGVTGLRCHTLAEMCQGVQMALDGKFDRQYIHDRAARLYDMWNVAKEYAYAFKTLNDVHNGKNGWYSPDSHLFLQ
jgi:glycosyltransferase involved in cell wall biosynthesis